MIKKEGKRSNTNIFHKNFRGQVTIFIILAIIIVFLGVIIYLYWDKIFPGGGDETKNPYSIMETCLEDEIEDNLKVISSQGGNFVVDQNSGYFYKKSNEETGKYVRYLCYTDENFDVPCINQEAFLKQHVEEEILNSISTDIENCFNALVKSYDDRGYEVSLKKGSPEIKITSGIISTNLNSTFSIMKSDKSESYKNFEIILESNLNDLLEIAKNIIIWEINVGDSVPEMYMYDNPYIRVEKHRKDNEVKIYVITDINTGEDFRFATRSFAAPVGLV